MSATTENKFILTDRLKQIQKNCRERYAALPGCKRYSNDDYAYNELFSALPDRLRRACSFAYALTHEPVYVFKEEKIHGMFYFGKQPEAPCYDKPKEIAEDRKIENRQLKEIPEMCEIMGMHLPAEKRTVILSEGGYPGHVAWNWDQVLSLGISGIINLHKKELQNTSDEKARDFHRCVIISYQAVLDWNRSHIEKLRSLLAEETDPELRINLEESIKIMERVPEFPARNFREALQSFHFQWTCIMYEAPFGGNSPGRYDYLLWPYLKEEYESGRVTYQQAAELIAELFLKCDERVHPSDGHVNAAVIGGLTEDGEDAVNPLTYICLDTISELDITHPSIYTRVHEKNPPEYIERCVEYMLNGNNRAQILSDDALLSAMTKDGHMSFADASRYICGGCMEINPQGLNSDLIWSFYYNTAKALELCLTGGIDLITGEQRLPLSKSLTDFSDFEDFYNYFETEMRRMLHTKFRVLDLYSEHYAEQRPQFLLSSLIDDCRLRGREQQDGGARYHDYGGSPLGIPNSADALMALKIAVFEKKICTAEELLAALKEDFKGHENLRLKLAALPKYGQGNAEADALAQRILQSVCGIFGEYKNRFDGVVKPVILTFVFAPLLGDSLGALPDGKRAGVPVAHGLTPQSSSQDRGLTAAIGSYISLPNDMVCGGASTMWDMDEQWVNSPLLGSVIKTFLAGGGQIFQGNTTNVDDLLAAVREPERYYNLIVRVGGFSARFVNLTADVQQEIINRIRHNR